MKNQLLLKNSKIFIKTKDIEELFWIILFINSKTYEHLIKGSSVTRSDTYNNIKKLWKIWR